MLIIESFMSYLPLSFIIINHRNEHNYIRTILRYKKHHKDSLNHELLVRLKLRYFLESYRYIFVYPLGNKREIRAREFTAT